MRILLEDDSGNTTELTPDIIPKDADERGGRAYMNDESYTPMPLEEMRRHEWVVSWSGGKDSTATILLMHKYGVPIKQIIYVRMMYDDTLPVTLPVMTEFIDRAAGILTGWGYDVRIVKAEKTALELAEQIYEKSKYEKKNGHCYGMTAFCRRACRLQGVKQRTIEHQIHIENEYQMIGYAIDETERLHRLGDKKQSLMAALDVKEQTAFSICEEAGLLSPLYKTGIGRDGCFFCPNAAERERERLRQEHPELIQIINGLIEMTGYDMSELSYRNQWIKEYYEAKKEAESPYKQLSIFDLINN